MVLKLKLKLQKYPLWHCCHVMYKLLYPSIRVRTAPSVLVRVRVRVSVSFSYGVTILRLLFCMCARYGASAARVMGLFTP